MPVTSLSAVFVIAIAVFTVVTIKLLKDKADMKKELKAMSKRSPRKMEVTEYYEEINIQQASTKLDIDINKNAAYSTVESL